MAKKNFDVAEAQHLANNEAKTVEFTPNVSTETKEQPKTLDELKKQFDRLNTLFKNKQRFESALTSLNEFSTNILNEDQSNWESAKYSLILSSGYNREEIKISNKEVLIATISYLKSRIETTINTIEDDILKA